MAVETGQIQWQEYSNNEVMEQNKEKIIEYFSILSAAQRYAYQTLTPKEQAILMVFSGPVTQKIPSLNDSTIEAAKIFNPVRKKFESEIDKIISGKVEIEVLNDDVERAKESWQEVMDELGMLPVDVSGVVTVVCSFFAGLKIKKIKN